MLSRILAFSTLGCPELTLEQVLELAHKHQVRAVELRSLAGTMELPAYLAKTCGTPEKLAARLRGEPVKFIAFGTSLKAIGGTAADREAFLQFVPWAEALGVPRLRVFDGGKDAGVADLAEAAATVKWWRELRAKNGWKTDLMVETHDTLFTAEKIKRFVAAVPDTSILWDTHHTWKKGGEDPVVTWRAVGPHVAHIHVKDSISQSSAKHPYTYVLPGDGEFPMAPLRAVLRAEYAGPVSLEWEKVWHPYLAPLDEALTASARRSWW